jgi:hypothetical protein
VAGLRRKSGSLPALYGMDRMSELMPRYVISPKVEVSRLKVGAFLEIDLILGVACQVGRKMKCFSGEVLPRWLDSQIVGVLLRN